MRTKNKRHIFRLFALAWILLALATSCSTTKKLGENDVLYTGVKHLKYHEENTKLDAGVKDDIFTAINVRPNNPLYSPYYRTPFPIGLMIYNNIDEDATGFKGWLYKHFAAKPVLMKRVNPQARVDMINTILHNNGYFTSSAEYTLHPSSNPKKAKVSYDVTVNPPYTIGNVEYTGGNDPLMMMIDSLARVNRYLQTGSRYCLDSLSAVRIDITNFVRNRGYYFFRPEFIHYMADSVQDKGIIHLRMVEANDIPNNARMRYLTHDIVASVFNDDGRGEPDTIKTDRCTLIKYEPVYIKDHVIPNCIRARKGRQFRVNSIDRTQAALSRLGIFSTVDIQVNPLDSITPDGEGLLDLNIYCQLDKPWEVTFEMHGASKSNSFIGPGVEIGATHKNAFGAGEKFSVDIYGDYEWQTGGSGNYKGSDFNSYEFGIESKLDFPRLLAPKFLYPSRRYTNWTRFSISADLMNRPSNFKMSQLSFAATWEWHADRYSSHVLTPFKLTYNRLLSTSHEFDSVMAQNPALKESFKNVFIPKIEYTYTFDRDITYRDHITFIGSLAEAGNIASGLWSLFGAKGTKELLGTPFSQFVKGQGQVVWTRSLGPKSALASRLLLGIAHAYGNSNEVPYREQFYVGGSNSVRAFAVRTLGPGSFSADTTRGYSYYDQTGTFKFEANVEYRFPILGYFNGAVFLDAGNIWLLENDENRPGGQLKMKNFFKELAVGTGLGLRFDMSMLVVRADLGIGIHAPYDTGKSGYFNMPSFKKALAFHLAIGYPF
jgi:outer membrane protein assembly factor BamA